MKENYLSLNSLELQILQSLKERRPAAINDLYDLYAPALYGTIKKSLLNEAVASETLMTTFKVIWSSIDDYNCSKERLFTWAVKIAHKEINKQKVELTLKQLFACNDDLVIDYSSLHESYK